jgi:hypothetical protein
MLNIQHTEKVKLNIDKNLLKLPANRYYPIGATGTEVQCDFKCQFL